LKGLKENENDAHGVIMQFNEIMGSSAELCGRTKNKERMKKDYI